MKYSNSSTPSSLNPFWVTGFTDAEGSFMIAVRKEKGNTGWRATAIFTIHLHKQDVNLLRKIQSFFKVGRVHEDKKSASFTVGRFEDVVNVIVPHFKKYPLQSAKSIDFYLWSQCVEVMVNKEHLTLSGLNKIVSIKCALNKGLSESLKIAFDVKPLNRPKYESNNINLDPDWVSGFSEGDGSLFVTISGEPNRVRVMYSLGLNERDLPLIKKIQEFFGGIGRITSYSNVVQYRVFDLKDICRVLIPHFDTYNFNGNKLYNYLIWKEIINLMENKSHLTAEGLEKIRNLRLKLNLW